MVIGLSIYFSYGIVKSVGYLTTEEKNRLSLDAPAEEIVTDQYWVEGIVQVLF